MVIVRLSGGIGNQMFQYAFGYYLSAVNSCELYLDLSFYENQSLRKFELDKLNINCKIASAKLVKEVKMENSAINTFRRKVNTLLNPTHKRRIVTHLLNDFKKEFLNVTPPVYIDGYWQSEKYFFPYSNEIKKQFALKDKKSDLFYESNSIIEATDSSVSVHIRRGDYVLDAATNLNHGVLSLDYYKKAVEYVKERLPNSVFFVFSDDIAWCKKNFTFIDNLIFIENSSDHFEDLTLMGSCKHNIIANSSYSWWAAWLNSNSEKIIIAPKKWFGNRADNTTDLLPKRWIKI